MKKLRMVTTETDTEVNVSFSQYKESTALYNIAIDEQMLLLFREGALFELAQRGDERVLLVCDQLLNTGDIEDWFVAVNALRRHNSEDAYLQLLDISMNTDDVRRRMVFKAMACNLVEEHISSFMERARHFVRAGVIDVTGWTLHAITAFEQVCEQYDVPVDRQWESFVRSRKRGSKKEKILPMIVTPKA